MNRVGVKQSFEMAQEYLALCQDDKGDSNWKIPQFFVDQASNDSAWDFSYVDTSINEGIATITINRPEAMNALNETVIEQLGRAITAVNSNDAIHTLVLDGAGKALSLEQMSNSLWTRLDQIPLTLLNLPVMVTNVNSIENSPKTTIALTTGLALGGGLELALCCDYRIGTQNSI